MTHRLADETLISILHPLLEIDDDDLISIETDPREGTFARRQYSTSDVLLVCKRWMRLCTPALFHSIVIRSSAQAQALDKATKKNPKFALYTKNLRLEGTYGVAAKNFVLRMPHIHTLGLKLTISATDNAKPMYSVLSTLNPRRLVVYNVFSEAKNAHSKYSLETLKSCIKSKWNNLHEVVCYISRSAWLMSTLAQSCSINKLSFWIFPGDLDLEAVVPWFSAMPHLRTITLIRLSESDALERWEYRRLSDSFLELFGKRIFIKARHHREAINLQASVSAVRDKMEAQELSTLVTQSNSGRPVMDQVPRHLRKIIWSMVCDHLHSGNREAWSQASQEFESIRRSVDAVRLNVSGMGFDKLVDLAARFNPFAADQALGAQVAVFNMHYTDSDVPADFVLGLLSNFSNLVKVALCTVSPTVLQHLAEVAGHSLSKLSVESLAPGSVSSHKPGQRILFPALRSLVLRSHSDSCDGRVWTRFHLALPELRDFTLWDGSWTADIFLPCLVGLMNIYHRFITAHGASLVICNVPPLLMRDVLICCPNLEQLALRIGLVRYGLLDWAGSIREYALPVVPALKSVSLVAPSIWGMVRSSDGRTEADYMPLDEIFTRETFPSLEVIHFKNFSWPTTPKKILNCLPVQWSLVLQERGIQLLDTDDLPWRPRLISSQILRRNRKKRD
ncbi:hypothetical protein BKA62DRAFT_707885 [Auriculariales sp. MPI-PUGE-AT-0066]|nr:hypothetical protein BKA62DRAFT_707885 [Auriculariales sp. MPI-PUGE-AT-0066]